MQKPIFLGVMSVRIGHTRNPLLLSYSCHPESRSEASRAESVSYLLRCCFARAMNLFCGYFVHKSFRQYGKR